MSNEIELDKAQMQRIFSYIEKQIPEEISKKIFNQLGHECFIRSIDWINSIGQNINRVIEDVNDKHLSPHWEKLEYGTNKNQLILTGRITEKCACPLSNNMRPESLCTVCCKKFQEEMFTAFIGKHVTVDITESVNLGGKRCSAIIHIKNE